MHEEVRPPSLVSTATLTATGQLPKFADDAYAIERDDLWCIPTAEVPLTSIYADETLDDTALPIRVMAHSSSYRREAGSAGRDTRGMLRAHEFDKVEILAFATPEQAPALLTDMVARAERAIAGLGLPYRIIEICTGDMGQSHHRSFDIEVYAPGADAWLEVSSISWFSDYQARRGNIRFKRHDADGKPVKGTEFVHTLNGSALAVPRGLGGDRRELPQRRRLGHRARGAAAVHARDRTDRAADRGRRGSDAMTDWAAPDKRAELWGRRVQYETAGLDIGDVDADPVVQWHRWHDDASEGGVAEPNAMTVATVDADGVPDARIVLVRTADEQGLVFFTNYDSAKSRQLDARPGRVGGVLVARSASSGPAPRARRAGVRRRERRLLRVAATREPTRCVGIAAERRDRRPCRARRAGDRVRRALRRPPGAATAALGRVASGPVRVGVLAGAAEPSPRPSPLSPGNCGRGVDEHRRWLDDHPPRPLSVHRVRRPLAASRNVCESARPRPVGAHVSGVGGVVTIGKLQVGGLNAVDGGARLSP